MAEKLEDLNLPNAVVTRIIREALPDGITVAKEARAAVAKAASIFILYLTSSANMIAKKNNRKTISGPDVLAAIEEVEFDQFMEPLQEALELFKKNLKEKKDATATKKKQQEKKRDVDDDEPEVMTVEDY